MHDPTWRPSGPTPEHRRFYKAMFMTDDGIKDVFMNAHGEVAIKVNGKAVWLTPASLDQVDAANPSFLVV